MAPRLRRWCWCSAGRSGAASPAHRVPAAGPPPRRPFLLRFPAPGSAAAPRAAAAGPRGRSPRGDCRAEREESRVPGWMREGGGGRGPGTRGGSRLRPVARAGLKEAGCRRCHHRCGPGPSSVQPFLPPPPARGCPQPGAPTARRPGNGREMAPRLRL